MQQHTLMRLGESWQPVSKHQAHIEKLSGIAERVSPLLKAAPVLVLVLGAFLLSLPCCEPPPPLLLCPSPKQLGRRLAANNQQQCDAVGKAPE
jgi:hypothetical protein